MRYWSIAGLSFRDIGIRRMTGGKTTRLSCTSAEMKSLGIGLLGNSLNPNIINTASKRLGLSISWRDARFISETLRFSTRFRWFLAELRPDALPASVRQWLRHVWRVGENDLQVLTRMVRRRLRNPLFRGRRDFEAFCPHVGRKEGPKVPYEGIAAQESPHFESGVISRLFGSRVGRKEGPKVPY